jgi:hypothetical protein
VADVRFETLEIPLINAEGANTDDFNLIDAPYAGRNGNNPAGGITTIVIDDNSHPLTQGLALGDLGVFSANVQTHWGLVPANGTQLASTPGNLDRGLLYIIEEGDTVLTDAGEFTHPARRVHFGMGNDGAGLFTTAGEDLFDRVIEWALAKPIPEQAPVITQVEYSTENGGEVTLSWLSIPERFYIIEVNEKLTGLWGDLNDNYQATDAVSSFVDNEAGDFLERFYRIRLIPLAE